MGQIGQIETAEQGNTGRRLEERASSIRRRAGAGGRAGRRRETHMGETRR